MKSSIHFFLLFSFFNTYLFAQNSMTGDGFGGRGWYVPHNYSVGSYAAYTVCGDSNQLYAWGANYHAEFGNGTYTSSTTPVQALGMTNVKFYTSGYNTAVIRKDSSAWVWGASSVYFGYTPQQLLTNVKFVDAGVEHVVFVKYDGSVWAAGKNYGGCFGNGEVSTQSRTPVRMYGIDNAVRALALGDGLSSASLILLSDGTVKITGGGGWFQVNNSVIPVQMQGLSNIVDIKGSSIGAFALDSNGDVFAFGYDNTQNYSVLGLGTPSGTIRPPTKMNFPLGAAPIVALSADADGDCTFALDSNHNLYGWGYNGYGTLGDGTYNNPLLPKLITGNVVDIFSGETFSYMLKSDSTLWATGRGGYIPTDGSIWMNLPNIQRNVFTQIDPTISPMNLCAPKVWGVVPVKLSSFTCVANGNNAMLNWQSAEETDASKYTIEYSNDGTNFKSIATVFSKGSNSQYNYSHFNVSGTAFYRLKMMDKDGSFSYSEIRVVKFINKASITIAPNPANDVVYIFTKDIIKSVQFFSADGQLIKSINNYNNGQPVNIAGFAKGIYLLKVVHANNEMEYARFVKR